MTNFDKMEQNFVALTEEELMDVDGGIIPIAVAASIIAGSAFAGLSAGVAIRNSYGRRVDGCGWGFCYCCGSRGHPTYWRYCLGILYVIIGG